MGHVPRVRAAESNEATEAVFALPQHGYKRAQLRDGTFRAETYFFEKGELWGGEIADPSIDGLTFAEITKTVAGSLAQQNYVPSRNPSAAQLRIVVSWGTTRAPEYRSMSMANEYLEGPGPGGAGSAALSGASNSVFGRGSPAFLDLGGMPAAASAVGQVGPSNAKIAAVYNARFEVDAESKAWEALSIQNARMLGYASSLDAELNRFRYFVVLQAYDNRPAAGKRGQLLWEARISISQHHNRFDARLAGMMARAAPFFGQSSSGMVHQDLPEGRVVIGELRSLDDLTPSSTAALSPDGSHAAYLREGRYGRRLIIVDLDRPNHFAYGDVPNLGAVPTEFGWSDSSHVSISLSSNAAFTFDSSGRRSDVWSAPAGVRPPADGDAAAAAAAAKFPQRTVAVRGWDAEGQRCLLEVSGGTAVRYYVLDRTNDLLIDLGRAPPTL